MKQFLKLIKVYLINYANKVTNKRYFAFLTWTEKRVSKYLPLSKSKSKMFNTGKAAIIIVIGAAIGVELSQSSNDGDSDDESAEEKHINKKQKVSKSTTLVPDFRITSPIVDTTAAQVEEIFDEEEKTTINPPIEDVEDTEFNLNSAVDQASRLISLKSNYESDNSNRAQFISDLNRCILYKIHNPEKLEEFKEILGHGSGQKHIARDSEAVMYSRVLSLKFPNLKIEQDILDSLDRGTTNVSNAKLTSIFNNTMSESLFPNFSALHDLNKTGGGLVKSERKKIYSKFNLNENDYDKNDYTY